MSHMLLLYVYFSSNNVMTSCYLSYKIAGDLFAEARKVHSFQTGVMVRVIKAYIMSLAVFDHLLERDCEASRRFAKKKSSHLDHLTDKKKDIIFWLSGFLRYPNAVENDLKVSALMF